MREIRDREIGHCFFGAYQRKMVNCVSASASVCAESTQ